MKRLTFLLVIPTLILLLSTPKSSAMYNQDNASTPEYSIEILYNEANRLDRFLGRIDAQDRPDHLAGLRRAAEARFRILSKRLDRVLSIDVSSLTAEEKSVLRDRMAVIVPLIGSIYQQAETLEFTDITDGIDEIQTIHSRGSTTNGVRVFDLTIDLTTGEIS